MRFLRVGFTAADGTIAVGCWNHKVYLLDKSGHPIAGAARRASTSARRASCVASKIGRPRFAVATTAGIVRMLDGAGKKLWETNLNEQVWPGDKPWTKNQKADPIAPGIWRTNGGPAHSDLGSQIVIEAPHGLILIDPNAGESFEQNWAEWSERGFDPMRIKYVLITHEHGDHAPGARLWRVITGAQSSPAPRRPTTCNISLRLGTGYGFHPPTPVDIPISEDNELDLAGLKVQSDLPAGAHVRLDGLCVPKEWPDVCLHRRFDHGGRSAGLRRQLGFQRRRRAPQLAQGRVVSARHDSRRTRHGAGR